MEMMINGPECVNCHRSNKVERVSEIVLDGFSTSPIEGAEPYQWAGHTFYIQYEERPASDPILSEEPTEKERKNSPTIKWSNSPIRTRLTTSRVADRLLPTVEKPEPDTFEIKNMGCFSVLYWPLRASVKKWNKSYFQDSLNDYDHKISKLAEAQEKWEKLYYCYRCEGVFAENGPFILVWGLEDYLFDLDPDRWKKWYAKKDKFKTSDTL